MARTGSASANNLNSTSVCQACGRDPSVWTILRCFPRCTSRELDQKWIGHDSNWYSYEMWHYRQQLNPWCCKCTYQLVHFFMVLVEFFAAEFLDFLHVLDTNALLDMQLVNIFLFGHHFIFLLCCAEAFQLDILPLVQFYFYYEYLLESYLKKNHWLHKC